MDPPTHIFTLLYYLGLRSFTGYISQELREETVCPFPRPSHHSLPAPQFKDKTSLSSHGSQQTRPLTRKIHRSGRWPSFPYDLPVQTSRGSSCWSRTCPRQYPPFHNKLSYFTKKTEFFTAVYMCVCFILFCFVYLSLSFYRPNGSNLHKSNTTRVKRPSPQLS